MAPCPSGEGAVCKTVYAGSSPAGASRHTPAVIRKDATIPDRGRYLVMQGRVAGGTMGKSKTGAKAGGRRVPVKKAVKKAAPKKSCSR